MTPAEVAASRARRRKRRGASGLPAKRLTDLALSEVSVVDAPANPGARHLFHKVDGENPEALRAALAEAQAALEESRAEIAFLVDRVAGLEAARAARTASEGTGDAQREAPPPPAPPVSEFARREADFRALRIVADEHPGFGDRAFWNDQLDALGRHLLPDASASEQERAALYDARGASFLVALQSHR